MYWIHLKLCLVLVVLQILYGAIAKDNDKINYQDDDDSLPLEQIVEPQHDKNMYKKMPTQPFRRNVRQTFMPNLSQNIENNAGFQIAPGMNQAPLNNGEPLDGQASSDSNKVLLVLNGDKNTFAENANPSEGSLKRLTRNPDETADFVSRIQQRLAERAKSFGEALGRADFRPEAMLGQPLAEERPSFFNIFKNQAASEEAEAPGERFGIFGMGKSRSTGKGTQEEENSQMVGSPLFPLFPQTPRLNIFEPLGMAAAAFLRPLTQSASEISEVRVLPEQYSPYKISPKQVNLQTTPEMKLNAVLKEALTKKTIPILWFHLPNTNRNFEKTKDDLEMEAKLKIFEQQVIAELMQLQELSKMANELKETQLKSGASPTPSLKSKLNLFEIPIYDITLGDIEKTLRDEHFLKLLHEITATQNTDSQRDQAATNKYLTDLKGNPIKRQANIAGGMPKSMDKDDLIKMTEYVHRMAALNGHEMPWIRKRMASFHPLEVANTQRSGERQWLEDKQQQMAFEAENHRQMLQGRPNMMVIHPTMLQQIPIEAQVMPPQMLQSLPIANQMFDLTMQLQQDVHRHLLQHPILTNPNVPQQPPVMQMPLIDPNMQQNPEQWSDANRPQIQTQQFAPVEPKMPETPTGIVHQLPEHIEWTEAGTPADAANNNMVMENMPMVARANPQMPENSDKARFKGNLFGVFPHNSNPLNKDSLYHDTRSGMHDKSDFFTFGKHKGNPTIINYYYNPGDQPLHYDGYNAHPPSFGHPHIHGPAIDANIPNYVPPLPLLYPHSTKNGHAGGIRVELPLYKPAAGHYGFSYGDYRTVSGDKGISTLLPQQKQQQQQQPMPRMMMTMTMASNEEPMPTIEMRNNLNHAEVPIRSHPKRLAKKETELYTGPVAYVIVIRNSDSKTNRSRRKRSTEYGTFEPIDENSLNALRRTYKDALTEIVLEPDESPADALMRYQTESLEGVLKNLNMQRMKIVMEDNKADLEINMEQPQQKIVQQPNIKDQKFVPETPAVVQQIQPAFAALNQRKGAIDDAASNQEGSYKNLISKYFNNPLDSITYVVDHSGLTHQTPQTQSQTSWADQLSSPIASPENINDKNRQYFSVSGSELTDFDKTKMSIYGNSFGELPATEIHYHMANKNGQNPFEQSHRELRSGEPKNSAFLQNIIANVKEQLVQCCNNCKDNMLTGLEENLKRKYYEGGRAVETEGNSDSLIGDFDYTQWLGRRPDKFHLVKQRQTEFSNDTPLHLYLEEGKELGHEVESKFNKVNQPCKRKINMLETEMGAKEKNELATDNKAEKLETNNQDEGKAAASQILNEMGERKNLKDIERDQKKYENELNDNNIRSNNYNSNGTKTVHFYATGKYFHSPVVFTVMRDQEFSNNENSHKLGKDNFIANKPDNNDKFEEIVDILQDLSKNGEETSVEVNSPTTNLALHSTTPSPISSTAQPLTTLADDVISELSSSVSTTNIPDKRKKPRRRRTKLSVKGQKLFKNSTQLEPIK